MGGPMNVLVLGGTRFMGKHLVNNLIASGHEVTIATRGITPDTLGKSVKRKIIDRTDAESIKKALSNVYYDVIYDSLAYCSNDIRLLMDSAQFEKYITISTTAVYDKHLNIKEEDFDPFSKTLVWCDRNDCPYDEIKRQAECALMQAYPKVHSAAVRFPFVLGYDDYTKRLYFYIDYIINQKPIFINNYENQMAFVRSDEAGRFLAFLAESSYCGAINGASEQTISIKEIAEYVESKTGKVPVLSDEGETAPYNGRDEFSINADKAKSLGFTFTPLKSWIFDLIDQYIVDASN